MIRTETPAGLDLWADRARRTPWIRSPAGWVRDRALDVRYRYRSCRVTRDWLEVWSYRKHGGDKGPLPPLRLRNGVLLKHREFENPAGLLKEVFLDRWYECGAKPPADATMVDIGAKIGTVSLYWAAVSPSRRIHAYEPNPSALDTLRQNLEANGLRNRMAVFPEAVGAGAGELDLWVDIPTELSTGYLDHSPVGGGRRLSVPMVGMDEVWRRLDQREIWLLKIDTEGGEADILEGAPARPVERHPDRDRGVP
jgi:FkbM family methyltransferase